MDKEIKSMNKNIIVNAFYSDNYNVNVVGEKTVTNKSSYDMYLKNIVVSLCSAKLFNPSDEVALITNAHVPDPYEQILINHGVMIIIAPFSYYIMPEKFIWRFAFYKLNALRFLLETTSYKNYLLLDTDTYHVNSLEEFWKECESNRLHMYSTRHSLNHNVRSMYISDYQKIAECIDGDVRDMIDQFGGEFVGCNKFVLKELVHMMDKIYSSYQSLEFQISPQSGDELFLSIAASQIPTKEAGAYLERFWTQRFYLSSTKWYYDPVSIWHIPAEKKYGMLNIYNYFMKHDCFPGIRESANILNLPRRSRISFSFIKTMIKKAVEK